MFWKLPEESDEQMPMILLSLCKGYEIPWHSLSAYSSPLQWA